MRDTHRLEVSSQSSEIEQLRSRVSTLETSLTAAREDADKARALSREDEEKRAKSINLLKAVRQKLVKVESEKEAAEKERDALRSSETSERGRLEGELASARAQHEAQVEQLRTNFEREIASLRAQYEREATARKGQAELDTITLKATHSKELAARDSRVKELEETLGDVRRERDDLFEESQLRQAELESSRSHQEELSARVRELEIEAREAHERALALADELETGQRDWTGRQTEQGEARRLLEEAERRHEQKVSQLEARAAELEKERAEAEEEMGRNLQERLKEVERLRAEIAAKDSDFRESISNRDERERRIAELEKRSAGLSEEIERLERLGEELQREAAEARDASVRFFPKGTGESC
jgi:chromosome segregation ATPase